MFGGDAVALYPRPYGVDGDVTGARDFIGGPGCFDDVCMCPHTGIMHNASEEVKRLLRYGSHYALCMNNPNQRLKRAREAAGFQTAKAAAESMGVPVSTYIGHENGHRGFPAARAPQYARKFKVSEEWLLYGKGEPDLDPVIPDGAETIVQVPVLGEVPAGPVREAIRHSQGFIHAAASEAPKDSYALKVSGESMNVHAPNGCTIIVDPNDKALFPGRRYVIRNADGDATFKEYHDGPARLVAVSSYDHYQDIMLGNEPIEVLGRVRSVTTRL